MDRIFLGIGAILGFLGVALGAFAAHGLKQRLPAEMLIVFETGVRYHMYHAIGLMLLGLVATRKPSRWWNVAGFGMFLGIILFSAMLYALVLTNRTMLGAIVPIGGVASIIGWIAMGCGCLGGFDRPAAAAPGETPTA
jgi:uncharacterized membrane protein YgdD (TMEM256/DUF423 family)